MSTLKTCIHCGGPVERATTTDNHTVLSDSCYGCRMIWSSTTNLVASAISTLNAAEQVLNNASGSAQTTLLLDELGRRIHEVRSTWRNLATATYGSTSNAP
jgi:hypothetical protein